MVICSECEYYQFERSKLCEYRVRRNKRCRAFKEMTEQRRVELHRAFFDCIMEMAKQPLVFSTVIRKDDIFMELWNNNTKDTFNGNR